MKGFSVAFSIWIKKFKSVVNQPPFLIVKDLLNKIPGRPFQVSRFFILNLFDAPAKDMRIFGSVRSGTASDIFEMCMLENKKELFSRRFDEGESCVVAIRDGLVVGYVWFSDKPFHLEQRLNYRLEIPEDSIYSYDCFIKHEYRLRGIWLLFQEYMLEQARQLARKRIITMVDFGNDASLKAHLRFGYVITREVLWFKYFSNGYFRENDIERVF